MRDLYWFYRTLIKLVLGRGVRKSYSQFGEDVNVQSLMRWADNGGVYVDVGCADPVLYSTTYHLYKRGWKGLCIDPNPAMKIRYALMRPRDTFVTTGIAEKADTLTYHAFNDETYNTFSPEDAESYLHTRNKSVRLVSKTQIPVRPLIEVLKDNKITKVDYMNIDVQGYDLEVLKSHDWSMPPLVISVEDEHFNADEPRKSDTYLFLIHKGYNLVGLCGLTLIFKR